MLMMLSKLSGVAVHKIQACINITNTFICKP
jgi:hypothetical protein